MSIMRQSHPLRRSSRELEGIRKAYWAPTKGPHGRIGEDSRRERRGRRGLSGGIASEPF